MMIKLAPSLWLIYFALASLVLPVKSAPIEGGRLAAESQYVSSEDYIFHKEGLFDEKQSFLIEKFNRLGVSRFDFADDSKRELIFFGADNQIVARYAVVLVGSWSENTNTWLWGWLNTGFSERMRSFSSAQKNVGKHVGEPLYQKTNAFFLDESEIRPFVAMAVDFYDANGMYIVPGHNGVKYYFVLIGKSQHLNTGD